MVKGHRRHKRAVAKYEIRTNSSSILKMMLKVSCLFNLLLPATISAANILILSALPSFSHHKW